MSRNVKQNHPFFHDSGLFRWCAVWIVPLVVRLWVATLRFRVTGDIGCVPGTVVGFWHRDIFAVTGFLAAVLKNHKKICLVSGSSDGRLLSAALGKLGFGSVFGSSSSGGASALMLLNRSLGAEEALLITPDGPKGPSCTAKPGIAVIASHTRKDIVLVSMEYSASWKLNSWDEARFPRPFSECYLRLEVLAFKENAIREDITMQIEEILNGSQTGSLVEKRLA